MAESKIELERENLLGTVTHLAKENEQLRGNLTLAEEGLANYQQENAELRRCLDGGTDCADQRRQFRKALGMIRDGQIPQAMSPSLFAEFVLRGPVPQSAEHPSDDRCPHGLLKTYHCYLCSPRPE